ncbi:hypothetical protein GCM10009092_29890 [Bowmanella denitrificans]|uniref:Uncharacterized protein n=1 Tax=Bowmanella denitrificans TaxID=366582 RepID=A0ABN0XGD7_9ALTE
MKQSRKIRCAGFLAIFLLSQARPDIAIPEIKHKLHRHLQTLCANIELDELILPRHFSSH